MGKKFQAHSSIHDLGTFVSIQRLTNGAPSNALNFHTFDILIKTFWNNCIMEVSYGINNMDSLYKLVW